MGFDGHVVYTGTQPDCACEALSTGKPAHSEGAPFTRVALILAQNMLLFAR